MIGKMTFQAYFCVRTEVPNLSYISYLNIFWVQSLSVARSKSALDESDIQKEDNYVYKIKGFAIPGLLMIIKIIFFR